jgi:aminopeptidase N
MSVHPIAPRLWPLPRHAPGLGALLACSSFAACAVADDAPVVATSELAAGSTAVGAPGLGDPLFPRLGNGGYEVDHYDLALRYDTGAADHHLEGTATILAHATQPLSRFDLDFAGASVDAVTVDGRPASASWDGEELVITPSRPLLRGQPFVIAVHRFTARARAPQPTDLVDIPFFSSSDGSAWAGQPDQAHAIFPCNDHPRDKASFSFRLDVPAGLTAVANGELLGTSTAHGRTVVSYLQAQPMATELAQVVVGNFTVIDRGQRGDVRVRDVTPARLTAELAPKLARELEQLDRLQAQLGPYPFGSYGSLIVDVVLGYALETQSLSMFASDFFTVPAEEYAPLMVHELAHQWFGNSVSPSQWSDVWQNEGHATWYELAERFPLAADFEAQMREVYAFSDVFRAAYGPVAAPRSGVVDELFNVNVYYGGALALYALRQEVGAATFQQLERTWVTRHRGRAASTKDFIALASELAHRDLAPFLHAWLMSETTPAMPGHADWTVDPLPASVPQRDARAPEGVGDATATGYVTGAAHSDRAIASRALLSTVPMFANHHRR